MVPIPKCEGRLHSLSHDDFRGISISCVFSKLFEMAIIDRYSSYFVTSDNQFAFKNLGCRDAIYAVRNVIEHYVSKGSTVNVCALDLSKAFDRLNHYVLYIKVMERKLPTQLFTVLEPWLNTCTTCHVMVSSPFIDMLTSPQTVVLSELYNVDVNCEVFDYWLAGQTT
jgi:Reverse transcriptase (RNA-dependent DNA polymerase)